VSCVLGAWACPGCAAADTDILGPIGPMEYPSGGPSLPRLLAVALALGFVAVAAYFLRRRWRRRAARGRTPHDAPSLASLDSLEAGDFYARLLGAVRGALLHREGARVRALTPRELAGLSLTDGEGEDAAGRAESWRALCRRAEKALYASVPVDAERRRADLLFVNDLLARIPAQTPGGGRDANGL